MERRYKDLYEKHEIESSQPSAKETDRSDKDNCRSGNRIVEVNDLWLNEYVERCISYGLPYLQTVLQSSPPRQIEILRHNILIFRSFLSDALDEYPSEFVHQDQRFNDWINQVESPFTSDTIKGPNAAWLWSTGNKIEINYTRKSKLIDWGYVFWDKERLDRWGILEQDGALHLRTSYD